MLFRNSTLTFHAVLLAIAVGAASPWCVAATRADPNETGNTVAAASAGTADVNQPASTRPTLTLGLEQAIFMAIENNRSLAVAKLNPEIVQTIEEEDKAVFDTTLAGDITSRRAVSERLSRAGSGIESSIVDSISGSISLSKLFPTGTAVAVEGTSNYTDSSLYSDTFVANRLGLSVTQALLQGADIRANTARIEQAHLGTQISQYELRGFTEALVGTVELTFWDYALAKRQIEIYTNSLKLAEQQRDEIQERIQIGQLAETELAAAQAEVALRRENLINARSVLNTVRLVLVQLLNPSKAIDWNTDIVLEYQPTLPNTKLDDVENHVQVALKMRPDLNQARLLIRQGELEVARTRNGLLPILNVFVELGKSGNADTFYEANKNLDGGSYDTSVGLAFAYPLSNRAAQAQHSRATTSRQQMIVALENLEQLAQVYVRTAYGEVNRTREQIAATTATRSFQEEKLRAETEKFRVGKSTSLLVAQAQRDLLASQIAETEAVVNYLKALVTLYETEGSLLQRRGLSAPGATPVTLDRTE
jgi:outer membrane protein